MKTPLISVNIVTRNRCELLEKSIKSVLNQSYKNFEIIIIDDDSQDDTEKIISSFKNDKIKYKKIRKQSNLSDARNLGINISSGKYIAVIDDDDEWIETNKLEKQVKFLESNPNYALIGTGAICVDSNGAFLYKYLKPITNKEIKKNILGFNCFIHSSVLFKKDLAKKVGLYSVSKFDENAAEDYNLWLKIGTKCKLYNIPSYSVRYTINKNSHGHKNLIKQFKTSIKLAHKYKKYYPKNRLKNILRNYARLIIYGYIKK